MIDERFPPPNLCPAEPLSQVVFIHDYLQLVFQSQCLSVYNLAQIAFVLDQIIIDKQIWPGG